MSTLITFGAGGDTMTLTAGEIRQTVRLQGLLPSGKAGTRDWTVPVPEFSYSQETLFSNVVNFTDETTPNDTYSYERDFGDGSAHSIEQNPEHVY